MAAGKADVAKKALTEQNLAKMPLVFAPNQGQAASGVRYLAHGADYAIALGDDGATLALPKAGALRLKFDGAREAKITAANPQRTKFNYFYGPRSKWVTNVPSFGRVEYAGVYAGIDAAFYGTNGRLEHDYIVAPGADASKIAMRIEGAKKLTVDGDGTLVMATSGQSVEMLKPVAYQIVNGRRNPVDAKYVVAKKKITFKLGAYDKSKELVIDPVILYGTMVGGTATSDQTQVGYDSASGKVVVAGRTASTSGFGTGTDLSGGMGLGGTDIYIAQMDDANNATAYNWVDFMGGTGSENLNRLKVLTNGDMFLVGDTTSNWHTFPTTDASIDTTGSTQAGYVAKVSVGGSLQYARLIGNTTASTQATLTGVGYDATNNKIYVVGNSNDFNLAITAGSPALAAPASCSPECGFATEIDPVAATIVAGTWLDDAPTPGEYSAARDMVLDSSNVMHIALFDSTNALNGYGSHSPNQGITLLYIDLSKSGSAQFVSAATFGTAGAGGTTDATAITFDGTNDWIVGMTSSTDTSSFETASLGSQWGYVAKFVAGAFNSAHLSSSAPLTTDSATAEQANAVAVDSNGAVYVVGQTNASDMLVVGDGTGSSLGGDPTAGFVSVYDSSFNLQFQRYVNKGSGTNNATMTSVAAGSPASASEFAAYFAGSTDANHVASNATALQPNNGSAGTQSFVFKAAVNPTAATFGGTSVLGGGTITYGIDGTTVYNSAGAVVSNLSIPVTLVGDAVNSLDYVTLDASNPTDMGSPATPLGLLSSVAGGCYNAAANTPGGLTCHLGNLPANGGFAPAVAFTPATGSECDEAASPTGATPCATYSYSVNLNANAAQAGAYAQGSQNFTVEPVTNITLAVTNPTNPVDVTASVSYVYTITNAGNHNDPNSLTLDFTGMDAGFNVTALSSSVATGTPPATLTCSAWPTCTMSDLPAGTVVNVQVTGSYPAGFTGTNPTAVSNSTVSVTTSNIIETSSTDNAANSSVTVQRVSALSIAAGSSPATAQLGVPSQTYNFTIDNATVTDGQATNASVLFTFPPAFIVSSLGGAGWNCGSLPSPFSVSATCTTSSPIASGTSLPISITGTWADATSTTIGNANITAAVTPTDSVSSATPTSQTETTGLIRAINAGVAPNTYPAGPTTLGAATSYGTDVAVTVTAGTYNQVPAGALTLTLATPTNFTVTTVTPPTGWSCTGLVCSNTVDIAATGTSNFVVAGSYNDDPANAPTAVQGPQFNAALTFGTTVSTNFAGTTTATAATTLNRISTLNVTAPSGSNVQLGVATTLTTTLNWSGNKVPTNYATVTFTPDSGFTVTSVTTADTNWTCTASAPWSCTNTAGAITATGAQFVLHGSYNDDPTRDLSVVATTGVNVANTATATGDTTYSNTGSATVQNGTYTLSRILSATAAANPAYPAGPITLGTAANTTYGTDVTVTVTPGTTNQVPSGALSFAFNVPSNFTLNPASLTAAAPFSCTGGPTSWTCTNTAAITASGTYAITGVGTYNDDPTNVNTPVVQGGQYSATEGATAGTWANTTIASVTAPITAATTLQRNVDYSFTSATLTDSSSGTTSLLNSVTYSATVQTGATSNTAPLNSLIATFTMPASFNITGTSAPAPFTCSVAGQVVTCTNSAGTVAAGSTALLQVTGDYQDDPTNPLTAVTVNAAATVSAAINNNTTVGATTASATTNLQRDVTWTYGTMTAPATAVLGSQATPAGAVTYAITMTSAAASATSNTAPTGQATLTYTVPANFNITGASILAGGSGASFTCAAPNNTTHTVSCSNTLGTFPPASTVTVQLAGNYIDTTTDVLGTATVTASAAAGTSITTLSGYAPVNGTTTLQRDVTLAVTGAASTSTPVIGASMSYTYTVANSGPDATASPSLDAALIPIQITFPADFAISSTTNTGWACTASGQVVTCNPSGTNTIASGANSTITITGSYTDAATFATNSTAQTVTATIGAPTATACSGAPCQTDLGTGTIAAVAVNVQRNVTLTTAITQQDPTTLSTTQVGATDPYNYAVAVTNAGPNDATAPTVTGNTIVTINVDANFTVSGYTYTPVNAADTAVCVVDNTTHTITCTFDNLKSGATETVNFSGTYASAMVNNAAGSATATTTASATDSLANVGGSSNSTASTLVMDTHLGSVIVPFFTFSNLTPTYATVSTSGITTVGSGSFGGYSVLDTYTAAPLSTVYPSGLTRTYTSHLDSLLTITNGLKGATPDVCATTSGFTKAERARIFSSASGTDLTNNTVTAGSCAFAPATGTATSGKVHGTLSDWTSGSNYASNLSLIEPVNRAPVVLTQTEATAANAVSITGNSVIFNVGAIVADPDINQPCYGVAGATGTCSDTLTVTISGAGATAAGPFATSGSSQTQNGYSGNPTGRAASTMSFAIPPNSTVSFTITATDQVGASTTQTYSIVSGGTTAALPPVVQIVNPGGTAVFGYNPGSTNGSPTACTLETAAYYASHALDLTSNPAAIVSSSTGTPMPATSLSAANIQCSISGSTIVLVTSGTVVGSVQPMPIPAQPTGSNTGLLAALTALSGVPVFGILLMGSKNKKLVRVALLTWLVLVMALMMVGCGGGGFQASPQQHIGSGTTPKGVYFIQAPGSNGTQDFAVQVQ